MRGGPVGRTGSRRAVALTLGLSLLATASVLLAPEAPAAPHVPAPQDVLGFSPGADRRLASWDAVLRYLRALDEASPRIRVEELGPTTQGRPYVLVTVTSEANQSRLSEIRKDNARLADPRGLGEEEAQRLVHEGRVIVAMGYSIHSTEVGGTLAALRLLQDLAARDDADVRRVLDQVVLLVLPSQNPDGTDLVAEWYARQLGTAFEGRPPPVLYHPYVGHDNNRDWYMFTQQETRLTVEGVYRRWHPQIVHDVHQMGPHGARIFVPPYQDPWEPNVDAALVAAVGALGKHVAFRLTSGGRSGVVTDALFDAWTPARAWPHTHGGVRLLSETASARLASPIDVEPGELVDERGGYDPRRPSANFPQPWPGGRWTLGDVVETQLAASLAVLDHASRNRELWLRTFLDVNRRASARQAPFAFVIPAAQREPFAVSRLVAVLRTGEVEVQRARAAFEADGRRFEAGSLVIGMQQPASAFAKTLLERQRYPDRREGAGDPPRRPYDVTAHTLPLLLGVEVHAIDHGFEADLAPVDDDALRPGLVEGTGPRFALGHTTADLVAAGRLLAEGIEVRWALEGFEEAGRSFPAGTLLVRSSARDAVATAARDLGLGAVAVRARPRSLRLSRPRVGVYQSWVPSMDEGWTRWVLEKEAGVAYQSLHDRAIRMGRLRERFDAIVVPDQAPEALLRGHAQGSLPEEYTGGLGEEGVRALREFVTSGGTLVVFNRACGFAIQELALPVRDALAGVGSSSFFCPGSILEARVDTAVPLAHGLPEPVPIWFEGSPAFEVQRGTVAARYAAADPLRSGFLLGGERLQERAALVEVPLGRGRVVLFGFRPQYRAQSRVTYPAFLNALYLSAASP
jgi:hypothetical protein